MTAGRKDKTNTNHYGRRPVININSDIGNRLSPPSFLFPYTSKTAISNSVSGRLCCEKTRMNLCEFPQTGINDEKMREKEITPGIGSEGEKVLIL
jgi:hypothetical protein